jgi:hypothetical protein
MSALLAFKGADFQTIDEMGRPSNQMRIAAALLTAKRSNKFLILRKYGMLFHTSPPCSHDASAGHSRDPSAIAPHSAVPSPLDRLLSSAQKMARKGRRGLLNLF